MKKISPARLVIPALVCLLFGAYFFKLIDFHEGDAVDLHFKMRGQQKADPRITIIAIDDKSITAIGQWPWPRSVHAQFLDLISKYQPRKVFFDILFTESGAHPDEDAAFALALKNNGKVTLPFFFSSEKPFKAQFPIQALRESAENLTYVNAVTDRDGKIRRNLAVLEASGETYYSPAILMSGKPQEKITEVPLRNDHTLWINFPGEMSVFRTLSFGQVVSTAVRGDEEKLRDWLQDRYVLIGHAATGTVDLKGTPFTNFLPGVAVHASLLNTILTGRYLREIPHFSHFLLLLFLAYSFAWIFKKINPMKGFFALTASLTAYFLLNFLFFLLGWIVPLYVPMTLLIAVYALTLFGKYTEIYVQKEIAARELAMAARIQEQFLPQAKPQFEKLDVAYEAKFLKEVGGDLYDWFDLGDGRFAFCVGDVSGKGMPAAIYMAKTLSDLRSIDKKTRSAGAVCTELNRILVDNPAAGMFLTLFYGILDPKTKRLQFASAGHEPAVLYRKKNKAAELIKSAQGMPLGMFEGDYEMDEVLLEEGDSLLLYTDGVRELRNKKREEFGTERLQESMNWAGEKDLNAAEHLKIVLEAMQKHQQTTSAHDDCTLFCLQFK